MEYMVSFLWWILVIGGIIYVVFVKKGRNLKAAQSGGDKEHFRQVMAPVLDGVGDYQLVYAHWEEQESYGRTVRTTFYRYAVAFQSQTMWIFPLHIDKKTRQIQVGSPMTLTTEKLGKITVKTKEKNGVVNRVDAWLGDKQGHVIVQFYVDVENLRKSRWYPLNLLQQEECGAFERFITPLAQQVASENPEVDAMLEAEAKEGLGIFGAGISIGGVLFGFCLPPLGVLLGLIGLIMTLVSRKKGAKSKAVLIISVICLVWALVYTWIYYKYIFI